MKKFFSFKLLNLKKDILIVLLSAISLILLTHRANILSYIAIAPLLFIIYKRNFTAAVTLCAFTGLASSLFMFDWVYSYKASLYFIAIITWTLFFTLFGAATHALHHRMKSFSFLAAPSVWLWLMLAFDLTKYGSYLFEFSMYNPMAAPLIWLTGGRGITFMVITLNSAIAALFTKPTKKMILGVAALSAILLSCYIYSNTAEATGEPMKTVLVQGNFEETWEWRQKHVTDIFDTYRRMSDGKGKESLIIWPEYALPMDVAYYYPSLLERIQAFVKTNKAYLVTGSLVYDKESGDHYDAALLFNPDGSLEDNYKSIYPAFYNENTLKGGEEIKLFTIKEKKAGIMICAEETDSRIARMQTQKGAQFLISISNDQNFSRGIHLSALYSRLRAAENYKYLVRATNTGVTQIINPYGKSQNIEINKRKVLIGNIPLNEQKTPYTTYGNILIYVIALLPIIFINKRGHK